MANLSSFYPQPVLEAGSGITVEGTPTFRTLSDRFGETVKVADFGAKGDWNGSTGTDDRAAIQAAIDYAIGLGRATVEFEDGKTYLLDSGFNFPVGGSLKIEGGTNSTELSFRGNGARIWIQQNNVQGLNNFFKIYTRCKSIVFDDLTFERSSVRLPSNYTSQENNGVVMMAPKSVDRIELIGFYNCKFVNTFSASLKYTNQPNHVNGPDAVSWIDTYNKIALFEMDKCKFIYPYGSNSLNPLGGGQIVNLSTWVQTAKYTGCYVDGAVGGKIPNDVTFPKDGFNYINATNNIFDSCRFQNLWVETIIAQSDGDPQIARINDFVQPAENNNVTVSLSSDNVNFNTLVAGDVLTIMPTDQYLNTDAPVGIYEVVTPPANWNSGTTMVLKRLPNSVMPFSSSLWSNGARAETAKITRSYAIVNATDNTHSVNGTYYDNGNVNGRKSYIRGDVDNGYIPVAGTKVQFSSVNNRWEIVTGETNVRYYNPSTASTVPVSGWTNGASATATVGSITNSFINCYLHKNAKETKFIISNCSFDGSRSLMFREDGTGGPWSQTPCILAKCNTIVSNCSFSGYKVALSMGPQYATTRIGPFVVTNNIFYGKKPIISGQYNNPHIFFLADNSIFANNIIIQDTSDEFSLGILVGGDRTQVINNLFVVRNPSAQSTATSAIATYTSRNSSEWTMRISGNVVRGFDYGLSSSSIVSVENFYGTPRTTMLNGQTKPRLSLLSPDGSTWTVGITNDGELEVIK